MIREFINMHEIDLFFFFVIFKDPILYMFFPTASLFAFFIFLAVIDKAVTMG